MPQLFGVGISALRTIYAHLRERESPGEGSERAPALHSPRPQALDRDEKLVLIFLASRGDYSDPASGGNFKWRGRSRRTTTLDEIKDLLRRTSLGNTISLNRSNKKSKTRNGEGRRSTGGERKATKQELMEDLNAWLFARPNLSPSRWIDGEDGGRVAELFQAYVRERRANRPSTPVIELTQIQPGTPVSTLTPVSDDGYGGNDDDAYGGDDDGAYGGIIGEGNDTWEGEIGNDEALSDVGSDAGAVQIPAVFDDSHVSPVSDMDASVENELAQYDAAVTLEAQPHVAYAPTQLRGRLAHFMAMAKTGESWSELVSDVLVGQNADRLVKGNIPSNWGIWASSPAPDQNWSLHGWTQRNGSWIPPPSSAVQMINDAPLPTGDRFGAEFGKFALRYALKMIPQDFVACLVCRTNERLHFERDQMQHYARWVLARKAGRVPREGERPWTYWTSDGREKLRKPTPEYLYDTDEEGKPLFQDIQPIEMLRYIGILIACRARSGRVSMNMLSESQSSLLAWSRPSRCRVMSRQRRQGIAYLLSGNSSYVNSFATTHQIRTGCLSAGAQWRFHEAYGIFNWACLEHAPTPIHHVSYDEFRHGFDGRLPLGMKRPAMHKAQGEGYDEMMMCCQDGYRLYGEIDFGSSKWAMADELCADGDVRGVPRARRILRIAKRIKPKVEDWCHIFADNLFTRLGSVRALYRDKFFYTGTTKRVAVNFGIPRAITEWAGNSGEHTALYDVALKENQACACTWRDHAKTKTVLTLSSFFRAEETSRVLRWDSEAGERVERDAPAVIPSYNQHMGYVDLHSQIAQGTMTCRQRTRRWAHAAFQDMLDSQLANAYILAKRELNRSGVAVIDHRDFLCVLAHIYCDVPASGLATRRELDTALRQAYGLYGEDDPDNDPLMIDTATDEAAADNRDTPRRGPLSTNGQPLLQRINNPTRLIGLSEGITRGQGTNEQHVHWPIPLPDDRKVNGVLYSKVCALCKSDPQGKAGRVKFACAICRLSACPKHYYDIHGIDVGSKILDETTANFMANYRSALRKRYRRTEEDEEDLEEEVDEENSE